MLMVISSDLFIILIFKLPSPWSELIMGLQILGWTEECVLQNVHTRSLGWNIRQKMLLGYQLENSGVCHCTLGQSGQEEKVIHRGCSFNKSDQRRLILGN